MPRLPSASSSCDATKTAPSNPSSLQSTRSSGSSTTDGHNKHLYHKSQRASVSPAMESKALARRATDTELMPPPPPAKRIKRPKNVIDEESYTDAISEIIARDFFPGLLEAETQQEYLDALDSRDHAWIKSAGRRLQQVMTPGRRKSRRGTSLQTPSRAFDTPSSYAGDTPMSVVSNSSTASQATPAVNIDTNMSLDKFQSLYTSEDNESFYKLMDKHNQKRAEKYAWMWSKDNKLPSKMMLKQREIEVKLLESRGSIHDDGGERKQLAIRDVAEKPARPDSWNSKPKNPMMFLPDSVEDSTQTLAQKAQAESRASPKRVVYANTRVPDLESTTTTPGVPASPSLSAVRDAISGHRRASDLESGFNGSETPRVNGYSFVDDEDEADQYPAPIINLGKGEVAKNPFIIKDQSRREDLHHRMVDKTVKLKRASAKNGMTGKVDMTPVPKFPSSPKVNSGQLTPAAQRLWSRVGSGGNRGAPDTFRVTQTPRTARPKSGLRAKWTPSGK